MDEIYSLEDLLDLQVVDLDIDRLIDRRHSLPELQAYRLADAEVRRIGTGLEEAESGLRTAELTLDKAEGELELVSRKREVEERRLYAGGLGARETVHLRDEVEMLGRQRSDLEDQILEYMEDRERRAKDVTERRTALEEASAEKERLERLVAGAWKEIDAGIARKEARKADIVPLIPRDLLELYDELRAAKEGVAVGRFAGGICGGCHLKLSAAEAAQALKQSPPRCIHCRRVLVPG